MDIFLKLLPGVALIAIMASLLLQRMLDNDAMLKRLEKQLPPLPRTAPVDGKTLGGWWIRESGQRVVARVRCQAPRGDLYRENFNRRRGRRVPAGTEGRKGTR